MPRLLVTAFEPFGGAAVNPTVAAVGALDSTGTAGAGVTTRVLPVEFDGAQRRIRESVEEVRPDVVLCFGVAGGRSAVTPERVAVNLQDARIPDNAGYRPEDAPVVGDGPAAHFSALPVKEMVRALDVAGIPADLSMSAGTFVCNTVLYRLLDEGVPAGFVHVPAPEAMDQETVNRAVEICVRTTVDRWTRD